MSGALAQAAACQADEAHPIYAYQAFGLAIRSDLHVPEFASAAPGTPDVTIAREPLRTPLPTMLGERRVEIARAVRSFALGGMFGYEVDGPDRITYQIHGEADPALLSMALVGPVIAMLLDLRGLLVLHGSAVAHNGRAALFLGDKGAGKSTSAAACLNAGMRLLTDDVVAVALEGGGAAVIPGFPQVKLACAAADKIGLAGVSLIETPLEGFDKYRLKLDAPFDSTPSPATTVYVLERGPALAVTELTGVAALTAIMRFSYLPRFGESATRGGTMARHLADCAALADRARVCRLAVPDALDRLDDLAALVAHGG